MTNVSLLDRERLSLRVDGRRIPGNLWGSVEEAERMIAKANALWTQVQQEAEALRAQAREEGFAAGRSEALAQTMERLAATQMEMQNYLACSEVRVAELALAVVKRIAPRLDRGAVLRDLIDEALRSVQGQRYLLVRVHPEAEDMMSERVADWQRNHPGVAVTRVLGDGTLGPLDVVVETEAGTVRSGFDQQLSAIGAPLQRAGVESSL